MNLCASCAMAEIMDKGQSSLGEVGKALQHMAEQTKGEFVRLLRGQLENQAKMELDTTKCHVCNTSWAEISKSRKLGCVHCLETFWLELLKLMRLPDDFILAEQEGGEWHFDETKLLIGRLSRECQRVELQLQKAAEDERYEEAAEFKKNLAGLKAELVVLEQRHHLADEKNNTSQTAQKSTLEKWGIESRTERLAAVIHREFLPLWFPDNILQDQIIRVSNVINLCRNLELGEGKKPTLRSRKNDQMVCQVLTELLDRCEFSRDLTVIDMAELDLAGRKRLVDNGWCDQLFAKRKIPSGMRVSPNGRISIRLLDNEHITGNFWGDATALPNMAEDIQGFLNELQLGANWKMTKNSGFFCHNLGYCGHGVQAASLFHFPALKLSNQIQAVRAACLEFGFNMFSWQKNEFDDCSLFLVHPIEAMSRNLQQQVEKLEQLSILLIEHEQQCRSALQDRSRRIGLIDAVSRGYAIAKNNYLLTAGEGVRLLSILWLGHELGMLPKLSKEKIFLLLAEISGLETLNSERAKMRAQVSLAAEFRKMLSCLNL